SLALMNRLDLSELFEALVRRAAELLEASEGFLYLLDSQASVLELKVQIGQLGIPAVQHLERGEGVSGQVWQLGQALAVDNYDAWPGRAKNVAPGVIHSMIGAPLNVNGQVVGVISLLRKPPGPSFTADAVALLGGFAQFASIALDNAQLAAEAKHELDARTQALAALHDSEQRYRLIAENTNDLISLCDREGSCIYASPSYAAVLGYAPVKLIGNSVADLVHHADRPLFDAQFASLAEADTAQVTIRMRHAGGEWRWIDTIWTSTFQDGARYHIAVGRDITDRKRLEEQFLQAQKMESIGRLAGGVAHDFNNLLTAILSYTEMARDTLPSSEAARSDLDEAIGAGRRAAGLTRQLLTFARRQVIEPQLLDLNTSITDVEQLLRRLVGAQIELVIDLASELGAIRADPGQIEQVLLNLTLNARDAMPNGGQLCIQTRKLTLTQAHATAHADILSGDYVQLIVSDTGSGMSADVQQQIFEPFFTTKRPGKGTGLGLAICYGIVKQHAGTITFSSEVGRGTRFEIFLPLASERSAATSPRDEATDISSGSEMVLLAEDETAVRALAGRVLRDRGYAVIDVADGAEALKLVREWHGPPIELLITDMIMPHVDGAALAEAMQQLFPAIKILFVSGYTEYTPIHSHQLDGRADFLPKPFTPAQLARKVRELLDRSL
ncbi:MAG TPA: ATP-binding protein, partial [Roseiflexaceae bacterium]|nr:ATP-binding protein [Roseiflexaceae bacterium]